MRVITATAHPGRYFGPIMATTHDGKRAPMRDAAKPKIDPLFLTLANRAVQSFANRLDRVEQHFARQKDLTEQGLNPAAIIAATAHKAAMHQAQMYAEKVDTMIAEHHADKAEKANPESTDIHGNKLVSNNEPPPDDRHAHMKLDSSSSQHAQKSTEFPMGDASNFVTPQQAKQMFAARDAARKAEQRAFEHEAATNRAFHARERALILDMKQQIERGSKERWG